MRAEQACVRQSLFPILIMQSLNAVLMSGIDRQGCKGNHSRAHFLRREKVTCFPNPSYHTRSSASVGMVPRCWVKPPQPRPANSFCDIPQIRTHSLVTRERCLTAPPPGSCSCTPHRVTNRSTSCPPLGYSSQPAPITTRRAGHNPREVGHYCRHKDSNRVTKSTKANLPC